MSSFAIASIAFAFMATGALFGAFIRRLLPGHHLSSDSRDVVKLGAGLIATQAALVVGLLVSSAKSSFDSANSGITQMGAKIILLDHSLARFGPETAETRKQLHAALVQGIERIWPANEVPAKGLRAVENSSEWAAVGDSIQRLIATNDSQTQFRAQAIQLFNDIATQRLVLLEQSHTPLPHAFLIVLIFWFTTLFTVFSLLTPTNPTVGIVLFVCAASVAGAIFLIYEMNHPLEGMVKASAAPLHAALERIGH